MKKNYTLIDITKFVMAMLVMTIHIPLGINKAVDSLFANSIARIAVPFFFMSSGYFFFLKKTITVNTLLKTLKRIGFLFIGWVLIYKFITLITNILAQKGVKAIINSLLDFNLGALWYLPALLIGIASSFFVLKYVARLWQWGIVVLFALVGLFGDAYLNLAREFHLPSVFYHYYYKYFQTTRNGLFFAFPFIMISTLIPNNKVKNGSILMVLILLSLTLEYYIIKYYNLGRDYNIMFCLFLATPILFNITLSSNFRLNEKKSLLFRKYSVGVYFLHPLFINLSKLLSENYSFLICLFLCLITIFILRSLNIKYINFLLE